VGFPLEVLIGSDIEKKQAYPTSQNAIISSQEIMGVIGIIELAYGKFILIEASTC
jgi:hypothetical protein